MSKRPPIAEENRDDDQTSIANSVPKTISLSLTGSRGHSGNDNNACDDASVSSCSMTAATFGSSEASLKLDPLPPPPPPPRRSTATHSEAFVTAVVLLQAAFRGRKARKRIAIMSWYRGLDKSLPTTKPTTGAYSGVKKDPSANRSTCSTFLSRPIPRPATKKAPASTCSSRIPATVSPSAQTVMKTIESVIKNSEESEKTKNCAAAAKKVLLRRTADYIAYLNALLKAHANEEILSKSEGIDAIVNELLCFLAMKALGKRPVPSIKIHRAWRVLVQNRPFAYIDICKAMGVSSGIAINDENYDPSDYEAGSEHGQESTSIKEQYELTKAAYTALFQSKPPPEFWPPIDGEDVGKSRIPANHLDFLKEENLPHNDLDDLVSTVSETGSDTSTSISRLTDDDDSLATMEPAALLEELRYLAEEQNIDIANLSYDSIVNDIKKLKVWVDKIFF